MQFPQSSRFHIIASDLIPPRSEELAPRPIYVYLPVEAKRSLRRRFPVIYCQDGQNIWDDPHSCFGHGGWYLNRICDELTGAGKMEPVILVGIPNSHERYRDYTPQRAFTDIAGHPYAEFVRDVVKPYIEKHFPASRARGSAALLGSSLGGVVSLWMAHQFPDLFSKAACLSGAFQVRDRQHRSFVDFVTQLSHQRLRIYLDNGTVDDGAVLSRKVASAYRARGWRDTLDLAYHVEPGAEHNERWWRERVWRALEFLFPPRLKL